MILGIEKSKFDLGQLCSKIKVVYLVNQTTPFTEFKRLFIEAYGRGAGINPLNI